MSQFSDLLSQFFSSRHLSASRCASDLSIDRSSLYQILHGKRFPADSEMLSSLIRYLHLTQEEKTLLREAFQVTSMGYDRYWTMRNVEDFLLRWNGFSVGQEDIAHAPVASEWTTKASVFTGKAAVIDAAASLISKAFSSDRCSEVSDSPRQLFLYLPSDHDLLTAIHHVTADDGTTLENDLASLEIFWLTSLDNTGRIDSNHRFYNLEVMKEYLMMVSTRQCVSCRYFYRNMHPDRGRFTTGFPYYLLLPNGILELSGSLDAALFIESESIRQSMLSRFRNQWKNAIPFFRMIPGHSASFPADTPSIAEFHGSSMYFRSNVSSLCIMPHDLPDMLLTTEVGLTNAFHDVMTALARPDSENNT